MNRGLFIAGLQIIGRFGNQSTGPTILFLLAVATLELHRHEGLRGTFIGRRCFDFQRHKLRRASARIPWSSGSWPNFEARSPFRFDKEQRTSSQPSNTYFLGAPKSQFEADISAGKNCFPRECAGKCVTRFQCPRKNLHLRPAMPNGRKKLALLASGVAWLRTRSRIRVSDFDVL